MMMPDRNSFSAFAPETTPILRENQYKHVCFVSLYPLFHFPRTHDSNIPEFQHSNWGEAPNLLSPICRHETKIYSDVLLARQEDDW
jgi:hypothetical protein